MNSTPDNDELAEIERLHELEGRLLVVRGSIIGALAGGHMEGQNSASYSKSVLLQIADILDLQIPQNIVDGTWKQQLTK